jgi:adhesin transport system membrane fusion protein
MNPRPENHLRIEQLRLLAEKSGRKRWVERGVKVVAIPSAWTARCLVILMVLGAAGFVYWAATCNLEQVVRGEGKVITSSATQIIQSLEGGLIRELRVKEGQRLKRGDVLLKLHDVQYEARVRENTLKRDGLRTRLSRLRCEAEGGGELKFPAELETISPQLVETERLLYAKRWSDLEANRKVLQNRLAFKKRKLELLTPAITEGAISEVEENEMQAEILDLQGQIETTTSAFLRKAAEEFDLERSKLEQLEETIRSDLDQLERTTLKSPVDGFVNKIMVESAGRVVQGGQPIMEIVPDDSRLMVEARIRPSDVAFIKTGQKVRMRYTAYDFATYGGMEAAVDTLGVDTVQDEKGEVYYPIRVQVPDTSLGLDKGTGEDLVIKPGMVAEVDILTGERTVLDYLLKPIHRASQLALRER